MIQTIEKYFVLNDIQRQQFMVLNDLYNEINQKVNLISRQDIHNLYLHHVLHSLSIARVIDFMPAADILDLGTGGGFPGIPLAILFPKTNFLLVDSIAKKIKAVDAIATALSLNNVQTRQIRAEDLNTSFDFVIARAVTKLETVWQWAHPLLKSVNSHQLPNGLLYLKGDDMGIADNLLDNVQQRLWRLSSFFDESYFQTKILLLLTANNLKANDNHSH